MAPLSRREFLLATAGAAVLAACGGGDDGGPPVVVSEPDGEVNKPSTTLNLVIASYLHVAGIDERLTAAFLNDDASGPLRPESEVAFSIDGQDVPAEIHDAGIPLPYFLIRHRFEKPGVVTLKATIGDKSGEAAVQVIDPASTQVPIPGRPMISAPSPTVDNPMGVDPICTREITCPLHDISLDAALAEKRPLAVLFATPARCQSRLCGPVLDSVLTQLGGFQDRVRFLHVEIFAARTGNTLAPTVKAYHLDQEPILFLAGADGIVRERLDNAFDRKELATALERLVS